MNVLITSIGSMSAEAVIKSVRKNFHARVIGCDVNVTEHIFSSSLVDKFYQVPLAKEEGKYVEGLLKICTEEKVNYIIPLTDPEVDVFHKYLHLFTHSSMTVCISKNSIELCRDKLAFYNYLKGEKQINLIPTYDFAAYKKSNLLFPLIAKPRNGRSSEGIVIIEEKRDLDYYAKKLTPNSYIIQPYLKGAVYTVDFVRSNVNGNSFSVCRKELTRTVNGAGLTVQTINDTNLMTMTANIGKILLINGCINLEYLFVDEKLYLMDINPRFSAGVGFSLLAGYDIVLNHLNCFMNNDITTNVNYSEMTMTKRNIEIVLSS